MRIKGWLPSKTNNWLDISEEWWREYHLPGDLRYKIENPLWLAVSDNGHRVTDAHGEMHYIDTRHGFVVHFIIKQKEDTET